MVDHYEHIKKLVSRIEQDINDEADDDFLFNEFHKLKKLFEDDEKPDLKAMVHTLQEALEMKSVMHTKLTRQAREIIEEFEKKGWFGKLIKKKKKKPKLDAQAVELVTDFQKALIIIQLIAVIQTQGKTSNQDKRIVLWVDDHPENNTPDTNKAKKEHHIDVVQKTNTKSAQEYLSNHNILTTDSKYCHFRVITDLYRDGEGETAGQNWIQWLRDNSWRVPVLVYCSNTLNVLQLQAQNSFVLGGSHVDGYLTLLAASTQTQLEMFFQSMLESSVEHKKRHMNADKKKKNEADLPAVDEEPEANLQRNQRQRRGEQLNENNNNNNNNNNQGNNNNNNQQQEEKPQHQDSDTDEDEKSLKIQEELQKQKNNPPAEPAKPDSPKPIPLKPEFSKENCSVEGPALGKTIQAGQSSWIDIHPRDQLNNAYQEKGLEAKLTVIVESEHGEVTPKVVPEGSGYRCHFTLEKVAEYNVIVQYLHQDVAGSPYTVHVAPGSPTLFEIVGAQLPQTCVAGQPLSVRCQARDKYGNPCNDIHKFAGQFTFTASCKQQIENGQIEAESHDTVQVTVIPKVIYAEEGTTYEVTLLFTSPTSAPQVIHKRSVLVTPAALDPRTSYIAIDKLPSQLEVANVGTALAFLSDSFGNCLQKSIQPEDLKAYIKSNHCTIDCYAVYDMEDHAIQGGGRTHVPIVLQYFPIKVGQYTLEVLYKNEHIQRSPTPFEVIVAKKRKFELNNNNNNQAKNVNNQANEPEEQPLIKKQKSKEVVKKPESLDDTDLPTLAYELDVHIHKSKHLEDIPKAAQPNLPPADDQPTLAYPDDMEVDSHDNLSTLAYDAAPPNKPNTDDDANSLLATLAYDAVAKPPVNKKNVPQPEPVDEDLPTLAYDKDPLQAPKHKADNYDQPTLPYDTDSADVDLPTLAYDQVDHFLQQINKQPLNKVADMATLPYDASPQKVSNVGDNLTWKDIDDLPTLAYDDVKPLQKQNSAFLFKQPQLPSKKAKPEPMDEDLPTLAYDDLSKKHDSVDEDLPTLAYDMVSNNNNKKPQEDQQEDDLPTLAYKDNHPAPLKPVLKSQPANKAPKKGNDNDSDTEEDAMMATVAFDDFKPVPRKSNSIGNIPVNAKKDSDKSPPVLKKSNSGNSPGSSPTEQTKPKKVPSFKKAANPAPSKGNKIVADLEDDDDVEDTMYKI